MSPEVKTGGEVVSDDYRTIAILDAGAQNGGLIERVVREEGVKTVILGLDTPAEDLAGYGGLIITGGPDSVYETGAPDCDPALFKLDVPVLGICYGMQLMAKHHQGGEIEHSEKRHDSSPTAWTNATSPLFKGTGSKQKVLMTHGDAVVQQPDAFRVIASCGDTIAGMDWVDRKLYATQFHPEVHRTTNGTAMLRNFVTDIADIEPYVETANLLEDAAAYTKNYVGERETVVYVSGGVDSMVALAVATKALGAEKVHAVHVNNGLLREGESEWVLGVMADLGIDCTYIDASEQFEHASAVDNDGNPIPPLSEVYDPKHKRRIIGDTFIDVSDTAMDDLNLPSDSVLIMGTLRPDLIESGSEIASVSGYADSIKEHHNDTPRVRELRQQDRVAEPLQALYKNQVRELALELGLPEEIAERQPFPGPGLAIGVLCSTGTIPETMDIPGATRDVAQALAEMNLVSSPEFIIGPVATVGVQGDKRTYKPFAAFPQDFATTDWEELVAIAEAVPETAHQVNRVTALAVRPGAQLGHPLPTRTNLTLESAGELRAVWSVVDPIKRKYGLHSSNALSQMPIIRVPLSLVEPGNYSIALRPFQTPDFMTGEAAIPGEDFPLEALLEITEAIFRSSVAIDGVFYDLTNKPPGTTEWE